MKGKSSLFGNFNTNDGPIKETDSSTNKQKISQKAISSIISEKGQSLICKVENQTLKNALKELYRNGDIGSGSTADAIIYEVQTGKLVHGKSHIKKGQERTVQLQRLVESGKLTEQDKQIALKEILKLTEALGGKMK